MTEQYKPIYLPTMINIKLTDKERDAGNNIMGNTSKNEIATQILNIMKNHNSKKITTKGLTNTPTFNIEGIDTLCTLKKIDIYGHFAATPARTPQYVEELFFIGTPKVGYNNEWETIQLTADSLMSILNWIRENEDTIFKPKKAPSVSISREDVTNQILNIMKNHNCEELMASYKNPKFETTNGEKYTLHKIETNPELAFSGSTKSGDGDALLSEEVTADSLMKILNWMTENENIIRV